MKICYLTFNFPRDYALAEALHASLRRQYMLAGNAGFIWCVESKHADVPVPEGIKLLVRDFNRGGNLKYTEALHAMTGIFAELAEKYDCIVKLDADTILFRPCYFTDYIAAGGDLAYIPHTQQRGAGNGCCYALSARAARSFTKHEPSVFDTRAYASGWREDIFFTTLAAAHPDHYVAMIPRNRIAWCGTSGLMPDNVIAAHLGYLSEEDACARVAEITGGDFPLFSQSDYARRVAEYCAANGIKIEPQPIRYTLDGRQISGPRQDDQQSIKGVKIS